MKTAQAAMSAAHDSEALLRERVTLLAEQSNNAVSSVLVGSVLIALVLVQRWSWVQVLVWMMAFLCVNGYRVVMSHRLLHNDPLPVRQSMSRFHWIAVFNGTWTGALPLLFFDPLPIEARLALTVMILLTSAGGVASYASHPVGYRYFVMISLPPLALKWALYGESYWPVGITIVLYGVVMMRFSTYLADLFERSVMIRFEREAVVEALRVEQSQSELERRRAEEANQAKSRFLANASHDLRQPAQALALYTAVLQRSASTDEHRQIARSISHA
ncbi:MAG TPA: histidine kinase dimerization/phospho-acceptor domain-containing protein, partial [Burkholderiaceae bacterium]|nr:histidine kinase dimerization/phospho-acceptor domain-containing protein [Burkholderiaceae bacterium]